MKDFIFMATMKKKHPNHTLKRLCTHSATISTVFSMPNTDEFTHK